MFALVRANEFFAGGSAFVSVQRMSVEEVAAVERRMNFVVGASCLVRCEVFERVGLLPGEYFLYYEDTDFALAAQREGYTLAWARESLIMHKEGGSTHASGSRAGAAPTRPAYIDYLIVRNPVALVRRYNPWGVPVVLASLAGVYINRVRRGQADRLGLILRAAWHGLIGKMGSPRDCGILK